MPDNKRASSAGWIGFWVSVAASWAVAGCGGTESSNSESPNPTAVVETPSTSMASHEPAVAAEAAADAAAPVLTVPGEPGELPADGSRGGSSGVAVTLVSENQGPLPAPVQEIPGITAPELTAAADATLPDESSIIGIVVQGEPRAYAVDAMSSVNAHVINDVIQQTPVTVTYCAGTKAVRVFSGTPGGKPLSLSLASVSSDGMTLRLDNVSYDHGSDSLPLQDVDFVQTEWIAWKTEHPTTRVFVGPMSEPSSSIPQ